MLSQKFKSSIYKLFDDKEKGCMYDKSQQKNNYEMENSYYCIFMELQGLSTMGKLGTDECNYNNYIRNGILTCSNGVKDVVDFYLTQLAYLDYMKEESKYIINECLDALDIKYVLSAQMYDKIKEGIKSRMWEYTLLRIHFYAVIRKIYFVWQMDKMLYMPDMMKYIVCVKKMNPNSNLVPIDPYNYFSFPVSCVCDPNIKYEDVYNLFQFVELLVKKYEQVDIFKTLNETLLAEQLAAKQLATEQLAAEQLAADKAIKNNIQKEVLVKKVDKKINAPFGQRPNEISRTELDNLKVQGLKEYCVRMNLNTTRCKVRKDYIDQLLPFVK